MKYPLDFTKKLGVLNCGMLIAFLSHAIVAIFEILFLSSGLGNSRTHIIIYFMLSLTNFNNFAFDNHVVISFLWKDYVRAKVSPQYTDTIEMLFRVIYVVVICECYS